MPGGPRAKCQGNSRKTARKTPEACKTAVFRLFGCPSGCFSAVSLALCPGPTRHLFRLFFGRFQGPAPGASVTGRSDRKSRELLGKSGELLGNLCQSRKRPLKMQHEFSWAASRVETFFARTAWFERKTQVLAKKCAKFVHAHSRMPHPDILRKLCRCTPAQNSHNLSTSSDDPAHLSHKFSGACRECPAHKFCTIFSGTWPVLKICLCTGNECLNSRVGV